MQEQSNSHKVLKGVSTQTLITILTGIIEIVSFSIMSRLLTQQDFGYYAAVTAVASVFYAFSNAGLGSSIIQRKDLDQKFIDNAFTLGLILGLFGTVLLIVCSGPAARYVADETMQVPLIMVAITLLTGTMSSISFSLMHRKLQFLRMGIIRISALIVTTIVSIVLAIKGFGYYAIIAKVILYSITILIVSFIAAKTRFHLSFDLKAYKEILGFGGWLQASSLFRRIAEEIDRLMMSNLFSVKTLGIYSRPKEFINSMTGKICDIFDSSLFPVLSTIQDDNDRITKSYQTTLYYLNIVGLLVSFAFVFNSELIIRIFLGSEWLNVNNLFIVLSFSGILMINGSLGDIFLRSLAFTKQQFLLRILQSVVTAAFILIAAHFGVVAVAVAYLLANFVIILIKMVFISKKIHFSFIKSIVIIINSCQMALVYVPLYILCILLVPNTIGGNLIKLVVFVLLTVVLFMVLPNAVGKKYKREMHNKVITFLDQNVFKKNLKNIK